MRALRTASPELLEREMEIARIEAAIKGAYAGEGTVLLIEGPAGIGKSSLLRAAGQIAGNQMSRLFARATELEREFPFGAVRQLLVPALRSATREHRADLLSGAAAHAAPALGITGPGTAAAEPGFATLNGLFWIVAELAEEGPLALMLDDAHWADPDSLRFLAFLAPRLPELPVLLLLAARPDRWESGALFAATASDPAARPLRPTPLSAEATAMLAASALQAEPHPEFVRACHKATGGNPFYLRALLDELRRDRVVPSEGAGARVLTLGPYAVGQVIVTRLALLSAAAAPLARAIAVLGDGADPAHAARLADVEPAEAGAVGAELVDAAILEAGRPLRFAHPIIRNAVYRDIGRAERADLHGRAAELLAADGGAPERIPGHLLMVEPAGNPSVVATLREAAANSAGRGAIDSAVTYLRRALDEPPPETERAAVLLELGRTEAQLLDPKAFEHLEAAAHNSHDARQRELALGALAWIRFGAGDAATAAATARAALEGIPPGTGGLPEAQLLLSYALPGRVVPEMIDEVRASLEASRAGIDGDSPAEMVRRMLASLDALLLGKLDLATERLGQAVERRDQTRGLGTLPLPLGSLHSLLGQHREAEDEIERALERARRMGSHMDLLLALEGRAHLRWRSGDLAGMIADAETEIRLSDEMGRGEWDPATMPVRAIQAVCLLERGDLDAAAGTLALPDGLEARLEHTWGWLWVPYARARLALACGEWAYARDQALVAGERALAIQAPSPDYLAWRSLAARALTPLGEHDRAVSLAHEEVELARETGSGRATGIALAALGPIVGGDEELEALRAAIELLSDSPARLEHARALVDLGAVLRRTGKRAEARTPLAEGMALAHECGAVPLAERAHTELRAAGARPRKPTRSGVDDLTPSELRVARMAAEGMSNRDIAQNLFVTVKTVEFHLGQTYRKLEISSRDQLDEALRKGERGAAGG